MFKKLIAIGIGFIFSTVSVYAAKPIAPDVTAMDTIAGFGTTVEISNTIPNREITIILEHSDGTKMTFDVYTDKSGIATLDIEGLEKAGIYTVYSQLNRIYGQESTFMVYPDEVSTTVSDVYVNERTARLGEEVLLTVKLMDQFENPIKGHQVTLISSRDSDSIELAVEKYYTNANGEISFEVSSEESGVSSYSVFDVTSGQVLKIKPTIYYSSNSYRMSSVGGNYHDLVAVADKPYLEISDLPEKVKPGKNITFTVTAYDAKGKIDTGYTGTVRIVAPGKNGNKVELPESDYTFTEDDLGAHTYSLGLKFLEEGEYTIEARDTEDLDLFGELEVVVGSGLAPDASGNIASEYEFTLDSPAPGTYGKSVLTLSGKAAPGYTIGFFDNDEEFGFADAKEDGTYSYETTSLAAGDHTFVAVLVDENSEILAETDPVKVTIDMNSAKLDKVELVPEEVGANGVVTVNVHTEEGLDKVQVVISGQTFELQPNPTVPTHYFGDVEAPAESGDYKIKVILLDQLGNESEFEDQAILTVLHGVGLDDPVPTGPAPSNVTGLSAIPSDGKVTLVWVPVLSEAGVKNYRIYYGIAPDKLLFAIDTVSNDSTWYIPMLENGTKYYFAVTAIDMKGQESASKSGIVEATPFMTQSFAGLQQVQGIQAGQYGYTYFPAQTGPEVLWLLIPSLMGGVGFWKRRRRD